MADAQWQRILAAGLCPGIGNLEEYQRRFMKNLLNVMVEVEEHAFAVPHSEYICHIHGMIMKDVVPWAGQFRKRGQVVTFDGGSIGTDSDNIREELDWIARDMRDALASASTIQEKAVAIAVQQGRMRRCHPFIDGNTRTGACILHSQTIAVSGRIPPVPVNAADFKELLSLSYKGIVAPFANQYVLDRLGETPISHLEIKIPKQLFIITEPNKTPDIERSRWNLLGFGKIWNKKANEKRKGLES